MKVLLLIFLVFVKYLNAQETDSDSVLCTAEYCANSADGGYCPKISDNCKIQNSTNNGLILPSPDPCNCCTYCIDNLKEGDYCDKGEVGMVPDGICGPGLSCDDLTGTCVKMAKAPVSQCSKDQASYDKKRQDGTLGHLEVRPECDDSGLYKPYRCIPGLTCFCVNKDGERIFGETNDKTAAKFLTCQCSRKYDDAKKFIGRELHPHEHFRCKENGDYDSIQCIGDKCMCVDASDGAPTYPKSTMVNMTDISNETLPCYDDEVNEKGKYFHSCAIQYLAALEELQGYKDAGYDTVFGMKFPNCDINGKYAPVQNNSEYAFCANSDGTPIEPYNNLPLTELPGMDCQCARTLQLLPEDSIEIPECCPNGSFSRVQCRRGTCYCVDSNGYQQGNEEVDEIDQESLSCYAKKCTFP